MQHAEAHLTSCTHINIINTALHTFAADTEEQFLAAPYAQLL